MLSVHDIAAYILSKMPTPLSAVKLHKLVYYAQAWSLVWEDHPLFAERIEAWVNGPVVPSLYDFHRGNYQVSEWPKGIPDSIPLEDATTIDSVLKFYGDKSSQWLTDLTHSENPWIIARKGLGPNQRGNSEITLESMLEYYSGIRQA